jgi:hypothetical protein
MRHRPASRSRRRAQGAAALSMTLLLVFAMLLVVAAANRNAIVETRASANHYRSTQSFEAAEAGLEWALARLNDATPIGDDCLPSGDPAAPSFRERYLRDAGAGFVAATWSDAGTPRPLEAACVRGDDGWSCHCPPGGVASVAAPQGSATAAGFTLQLADGARPGIVRAIASGCTFRGSPCAGSADGSHQSAARVEVALALLPGLRAAPVAALTVGGNVDAGAGALGVYNRDAATGGIALHAGGTVAANALRLGVPAGSPLDVALVSGDAELAALAADRFFARWFGMDLAAWRAQPAATALSCAGNCASTLAGVLAAGARLVAAEGDVVLDGPLALGTPERPVVLVVPGALRLRGAVAVHGVVVAGSLAWHDAAENAGALVRGAALVEGSYQGDAAADFVRDPTVLAWLRRQTGSFARVNGSWKDF